MKEDSSRTKSWIPVVLSGRKLQGCGQDLGDRTDLWENLPPAAYNLQETFVPT